MLPHRGPRRPRTQIAYNSCRNRHCPKCQGAAANDWLAARKAELLPVAYYRVVLTLPAPISDITYQNKAEIYGIMFRAAAETLITIAADPKHLGARTGLTSPKSSCAAFSSTCCRAASIASATTGCSPNRCHRHARASDLTSLLWGCGFVAGRCPATAEEDGRMSRAVLERVRALTACLLLLQSLSGCGATEEAPRGPWTRVAPMPTARSELAAAALDGRIYVAGGIAQWGTTTAFEAYDPAMDRWEELPPLPEAVHHLAAAATDDRIYITGGYTDLLFSETTTRAWAYDPRARIWHRIADLPAPRAAHGMAAIEGKLYVVGGVGPDSEELWIYDPATERWDAARAALPTQREHLAVTVLDGDLYVLGGRWGDSGNLAALEIYDPAAGTWTRGPDLPTPRSGLTAGVLDGHVQVTGGESLSGGRTFGEHEAYDPTTATWTALAGLPTPRHGLASVVVSGRWYVIGGGTRAGAMTFISLSDRVEVFPGRSGGAG